MTSYDISSFMTWFVSQFFTILTRCLDFLRAFKFGGISLLDYTLALLCINAALSFFILSEFHKGSKEKNPKGGK